MKYCYCFLQTKTAYLFVLLFLLLISCGKDEVGIPKDTDKDDEEIVVDEELMALPIRDIVSKLYPEKVYVGVAE